ncbi:hypothetical protein F5I97DRAFT_1784610, partial [Phlebopus sp. FC_14]
NLSHSTNSSSSAIDFSGTGLASSSVPPSPTLHPSDTGRAFARRRASWGKVDAGLDPLRLDIPATEIGSSNPIA